MNPSLLFTHSLLAVAALSALAANEDARADSEKPTDRVSFVKQIAPILVKRCEACHGAKTAESSYRVDSFQRAKTPGDYESAPFTPSALEDSLLYQLIISDDPDERMPKEGEPLPAEELALFKAWIEQGAQFDGPDPNAALVSIIPRPPYPTPPESYPSPVPVTAIAYHPSGEELYVGGYHEITVWNPSKGEVLRRIDQVTERTYRLAFSPDGALLAVAGGVPGRSGEVRLIRTENGQEVHLLGTTTDVILDVAFDAEGKRVATASADRAIRIYDAETGKEVQVIENHADWVTAVAWSPDGKQLASTSRDKTAKLFEVETGNLVATYSGHGQPVYGVVFADDKQIFTSGGNKEIHLWNIKDSKKAATIGGIGGEIYKLQLVDGQLFSASADKTARQHKVEDRKQVRVFPDHSDWVFALAVHAPSQRLATGCFDGQVKVWNLEDGSLVSTFVAAPGYEQAN